MRAQNLIAKLCLTAFLCLSTATSLAQVRKPAVPLQDMVPVELATVVMIRGTNTPVALLREPNSGSLVPIFIGIDQAQSILIALHAVELPRPNSHDLMESLLSGVKVKVTRVFVDSMVSNTYLGLIELTGEAVKPVLIDARPSDALALALRAGASIHVAPSLLASIPHLQFESLGNEDVVNAAGITVMSITDELREALTLPQDPGVLVSRATGLAAEAGMKPGALITQVNNKNVSAPLSFLDALRKTTEGKKAQLSYWQAGKTHEIEIDTAIQQPALPRLSPDAEGRWM